MRQPNKKNTNLQKPKPVDMYKSDEFVMTFSSQKEAAQYLGATSGSPVCAVLNGRMKSYKGYTFKYAEEV